MTQMTKSSLMGRVGYHFTATRETFRFFDWHSPAVSRPQWSCCRVCTRWARWGFRWRSTRVASSRLRVSTSCLTPSSSPASWGSRNSAKSSPPAVAAVMTIAERRRKKRRPVKRKRPTRQPVVARDGASCKGWHGVRWNYFFAWTRKDIAKARKIPEIKAGSRQRTRWWKIGMS